MIAGPNGSGKSTAIEALALHRSGLPVVSPDIYATGLTHIGNARERNLLAAKHCEAIRERLLAQRESFAFETVGSTKGKVEFVSRAVASGYRVSVLFVTTSDPSINIERIADRVKRGGHDVPEDKVVERYHRAMALLHRYLELADEALVYDNSGNSPALAVSKTDGEVTISPGFTDCRWIAEYVRPWF